MMKKIEKEKRRNKWSHWRPWAIVFDKKGAAKRCNMIGWEVSTRLNVMLFSLETETDS